MWFGDTLGNARFERIMSAGFILAIVIIIAVGVWGMRKAGGGLSSASGGPRPQPVRKEERTLTLDERIAEVAKERDPAAARAARRRLAEQCIRAGRAGDAVKLYEAALAGARGVDPALTFGLVSVWRLYELLRDEEANNRTGSLVANGILFVLALWVFQMANSATSLICFLLGSALIVGTSVRAIVRQPAIVHTFVAVMLFVVVYAVLLNPSAGIVEMVVDSGKFFGEGVQDPVELGVDGGSVGLVINAVQQRFYPSPGALGCDGHQVRRVVGAAALPAR